MMFYTACLDAMIRFLKAKLRVMQEEMDKLHAENSSKVSLDGSSLGDKIRNVTNNIK